MRLVSVVYVYSPDSPVLHLYPIASVLAETWWYREGLELALLSC